MPDLGETTLLDLKRGSGVDGDTTILSNTDLGSANQKQYSKLTINTSITLEADAGLNIQITGDLVLNGTISEDGKGSVWD